MQADEYQKDLTEKLLQESRKADKADKELADAMIRLLKNPDFQTYMTKIIYPRCETFGAALLTASGGMDGMVRSEFIKGTLCGLCLARDMPSVIIQAMENTNAST